MQEKHKIAAKTTYYSNHSLVVSLNIPPTPLFPPKKQNIRISTQNIELFLKRWEFEEHFFSRTPPDGCYRPQKSNENNEKQSEIKRCGIKLLHRIYWQYGILITLYKRHILFNLCFLHYFKYENCKINTTVISLDQES